MKISFKTFAFIVTLLLLPTLPSFGEKKEIEMPDGFTDIYPDMPLKDFLLVRKNAKRSDFLADPKKLEKEYPNPMFIERIDNHPFFIQALYIFEQGRLEAIALMGDAEDQTAESKKQAFIANLVEKWGKPSYLKVVQVSEREKDSRIPALVWEKGKVLIGAAIPMKSSSGKEKGSVRPSYQIKIRYKENAGIEDIFLVPAISKKEEEEILNPIQSILDQLLTHEKSKSGK